MAEKPVTMEGTVPEAKYQKLASEYSKLRAQATVLKKAVLEEQAKEGGLREQLQQYATSLRRTEQEVDSLGFRNKQLESRVSHLQQEISAQEQRKKKEKEPGSMRGLLLGGSSNHRQDALGDAPSNTAHSETNAAQEALIFEELQKKIMENAQLTSLIDDKQRDLLLHTERIASLEQKLEKRIGDQNELEKRLRKEVETLQHRNSELETKLVDAASMLGSEDALSATGSDNTPLHNMQQPPNITQLTAEDRIVLLEKEAAHWRAQFEVAKLHQAFVSNPSKDLSTCSCSTAAAGVTVRACEPEQKGSQRARDSLQEPPEPPTKEQLIYSLFSKKFEDLLRLKIQAESKLRSYELEVQHLQNCLENADHELKAKEEQLASLGGALQMLEEELTTTRINYEEQISVLTEQVINLSDQLAACK
ncbi:hypothetical protein KR009_007656 [Drosophila setifemur]|nr:hypothetical protein KR009_007656 [Drosophila setifemur]